MPNEIDSTTGTLLIVLGLFFAIIFLISIVTKFKRFTKELRYINMEINRNTGSQKKHWQREKRRLWLLLLPFFRR